MNELTIISIKDIMRILKCGKYTATKIRKDICEEYVIDFKRITYGHLKRYLKLEE
ncbi:hypothetical protein ACF3OE_00485 [Capnocytophaga canis]|uniref:hypothetical protein n=1 Tax=Capnocytophaga canis TaxID=1848903 RepID=UPI00370DAB15